MYLYGISYLAGIFTILAPCVLVMIPVILGSGIETGKVKRLITIIGAFSISVIVFIFLVKYLSQFLGLSTVFWYDFSGILLILIGIFMLFPKIRDTLVFKLKLSNHKVISCSKKKGIIRDVLLGISLGPIFTTCSPTFGIILTIVLPISVGYALVAIGFYTLGLATLLFLIGFGGIKIVQKLRTLSKPTGLLKKIVAIIIIFTGVLFLTGLYRNLELFFVQHGIFVDTFQIENDLLNNLEL